jgi:DNA-directed RNA polymerase alpha subunit
MLLSPLAGGGSSTRTVPDKVEARVESAGQVKSKRAAKRERRTVREKESAAVKVQPPPAAVASRGAKVPKSLSGQSKTPAGEDICFSYNSEGGCQKAGCARKHVCMKCFKEHPLHKHV